MWVTSSFLFVRRGTQSSDELLAAIPVRPSPCMMLGMINTSDILSIGENARACTLSVAGDPSASAADNSSLPSRFLQGAVEASRLRSIKRIELPLSVRKKARVCYCRDGVPHCGDYSIAINARTGIIHEHVISAGRGGKLTLAKVHCKTCAGIKTGDEDKPHVAKADRVIKRSYGLRKRRRTIPGRKFDETPVRPRWVEE